MNTRTYVLKKINILYILVCFYLDYPFFCLCLFKFKIISVSRIQKHAAMASVDIGTIFSFTLITKKILLQIQSEFEDSYLSFS